MSTPQQPELARSLRSPATPDHVKGRITADSLPDEGAGGGPIPEDNLPGHHPPVEQDKPTGPPNPKARPAKQPKAKTKTEDRPAGPRQFDFEFDPRLLSFLFGVTPGKARVQVRDDGLVAQFGLVRLQTPLGNVAGAEITGPYSWAKVVGPPRLSMVDRGLTFATNARRGVCIRFKQPVSVGPLGWLRHPALTVTVADPEGLAEALTATAEATEA
jgi:hypothetical protein